MKKIAVILATLLLTFFLVSCSKSKVKIEQESFEGNTYEYVVTYQDKELEIDELKSLSYNTTYEIYQTIKADIGTKKVYINILVKVKSEEKIKLTYVVNQSYESPGLKLLKETVK